MGEPVRSRPPCGSDAPRKGSQSSMHVSGRSDGRRCAFSGKGALLLAVAAAASAPLRLSQHPPVTRPAPARLSAESRAKLDRPLRAAVSRGGGDRIGVIVQTAGKPGMADARIIRSAGGRVTGYFRAVQGFS